MAINITRWTVAVLMLLSIMPSVFGFYFYLEGSEQKCFTEQLPKQTLVTGVYAAEEWSDDKQMFVNNKDVQLEVVVEEVTSGNRVFGQKLSPKGTFKFTSAESGDHNICLFTSTAGWFSSTKIRLTFDMSIRDIMEDATEHDEGTLSELALRVRELNQKVSEIRREQIFLREHEVEFRNQSETTNGHTVTWTIIQLVVLGIACTAQLRSLRKFFEAKKLV